MSRVNERAKHSEGGPGGAPRRLLATNQVVGPLMKELLVDLGRAGVRCAVVTGWIDASPGETLPFEVLRACPLVKAPLWKRIATWSWFSLQALWRLMRQRRVPALVVTNPPLAMLAMPLLKRFLGVRYVLMVYDIYPDVGERMGLIRRGGWVARVWRALSRRALLDAEGVITLGTSMADTLRRHLREGDRCDIRVIANWADTDVVRPGGGEANAFAVEHGLAGKMVVMYSGNFGATHDIESIVEAAERLRDLSDLRVVLSGGGTRELQIRELVAGKRLPNLLVLPFQPPREYHALLASADCAVVTLAEGYEGVSIPSKTYYALAAGLAVLAICDAGTELARVVTESGSGMQIPPRRPEVLSEAIRKLYNGREGLSRVQASARRAAEAHFSRNKQTRRYLDYLGVCFGWEALPEG